MSAPTRCQSPPAPLAHAPPRGILAAHARSQARPQAPSRGAAGAAGATSTPATTAPPRASVLARGPVPAVGVAVLTFAACVVLGWAVSPYRGWRDVALNPVLGGIFGLVALVAGATAWHSPRAVLDAALFSAAMTALSLPALAWHAWRAARGGRR